MQRRERESSIGFPEVMKRARDKRLKSISFNTPWTFESISCTRNTLYYSPIDWTEIAINHDRYRAFARSASYYTCGWWDFAKYGRTHIWRNSLRDNLMEPCNFRYTMFLYISLRFHIYIFYSFNEVCVPFRSSSIPYISHIYIYIYMRTY